MNRFARSKTVRGGQGLAANNLARRLQIGIESQRIEVRRHILVEGERLDHIAARELGNANLWWLLAACSKIGWGLQLPPGTVIVIPTNLAQVEPYVG